MAPVCRMPEGNDDDMREMMKEMSYIVSSAAEDCDDERRFVWDAGNTLTQPGFGSKTEHSETIRGGKSGGFSKHQENFSATKYIKP